MTTHNISLTGRLLRMLVLVGAMALASACSCSTDTESQPSPEFATYVSGYMGGYISKQGTIKIELTQRFLDFDGPEELSKNPFSFSPSIKGKAFKASDNTIEFVPDEGQLKRGQTYKVQFALDKFVNVPKDLQTFAFSFVVQPMDFSMNLQHYSIDADAPQSATIEGSLMFSDAVSDQEASKMITTDPQCNVDMTSTGNGQLVNFRITNIVIKDADYQLTIKADGSSIGADRRDEQTVGIASGKTMKVLYIDHITSPSNGMEIGFSKPLSKSQNLSGLIEVSGVRNPSIQVRGNKALVFFDSQSDRCTVTVHEGVRAYDNDATKTTEEVNKEITRYKPAVEIRNGAAILPDSKKLTLDFRAANLNAVDMSIIKIYEGNVMQFFQDNKLDNNMYLRRVGRLVYRKTLALSQNKALDIHKWNNYSIDLSELFQKEPGAIYRVVLSFNRQYSAYPGANDGTATFSENVTYDDPVWDTPEAYYDYSGMPAYNWETYDWSRRNDPTSDSYYMDSDKSATCNVMVSNIGLMVKNNGNTYWAIATDILSAQASAGTKVTIYNYQLQPIAQAKTDADGFCKLDNVSGAFLAVADDGKQKTYLRLVNGESLSVSRFDVGGETIRNGLKGFIYGERGVWRPGDTLHLTMMVDDREGRLPESHPAILEVSNARGAFHCKQVNTNGMGGVYTFIVPTSQTDPTGTWTARISVGNETFSKSLMVETVKPNRLKIDLKVPQMIGANQEYSMPLHSEWLTGAKASGLKATLRTTLSKTSTTFDKYKDYVFDMPCAFESSTQEDIVTNLDASGNAKFALKMPSMTNAVGMLRARMVCQVYEPGGDASFMAENTVFSPYQTYVGLHVNYPSARKELTTDTVNTFDVVTVDASGKAVNASNLEYRIYEKSWSWWYDEENDYSQYFNGTADNLVASGKLKTTGGKGHFTFRLNYPSWGRYVVIVRDSEGGHACSQEVYIDWPSSRGRSNRKNPSGASMLTFSTDKQSYAVGEKATVTIPRTAAGGRALVTIENGSTILRQQWIDVAANEDTRHTFDITTDMTPNAYLSISLLQPHAQTANDMPLRMYGVAPIFAADRQTVLEPQIKMPGEMEPERDFSIEISEKQGREMTYTIAIVDEGLLSLTNFRTPDPWSAMYQRQALGIRTWDMYSNVVSAQVGNFAALFSTGGSDELNAPKNEAQRFNPVVKVLGPFTVEKGKTQKHTVRLPMYVGEVRTMVVAKSGLAYGSAQKSSKVRSGLMLLTTLPRVLSVGEEINVPVNVFAQKPDVKNVEVQLTANGTDAKLASNKQNLTFAQEGNQMAYFRLSTGNKVGKLTLKAQAKSGKHTTHQEIEIEVRNPNPAVTQKQSAVIEGHKSATLNFSTKGATTKPEVKLELMCIPPFDITGRYEFVYNYSHYCSEQVTSRALPLLFVQNFKTVSEEEQQRIADRVNESLKQLYARQLSNGSFSYWQGGTYSYSWVNTYVGIFLTMAKEKGYDVNPAVYQKWKNNQRAAANISYSTDKTKINNQAFALYALALAGDAQLSIMNRCREQEALTRESRYLLAAAYGLSGNKKVASQLLAEIDNTTTEYVGWFDSRIGLMAQRLTALMIAGDKKEMTEQAIQLSEAMNSERYYSTSGNALALMAMANLASGMSSAMDYQVSLNGKKLSTTKTSNKAEVISIDTKADDNTIEVTNKKDDILFATVSTRTQLLNDTLTTRSNGIKMDISYVDNAGNKVDPSKIAQGTTFDAIITLGNTQDDNINVAALTYTLPSGWEVYADQRETQSQSSSYEYQDIRDDRVLTYFSLAQGATKTIKISLQASYEGRYTLPAVLCEDMYHPEVCARSQAQQTTVEREP